MAKETLIFCDFCNGAKKVGDLKNLIQRGVFWAIKRFPPARHQAKEHGWKWIKFESDICPACIDEGREEDI